MQVSPHLRFRQGSVRTARTQPSDCRPSGLMNALVCCRYELVLVRDGPSYITSRNARPSTAAATGGRGGWSRYAATESGASASFRDDAQRRSVSPMRLARPLDGMPRAQGSSSMITPPTHGQRVAAVATGGSLRTSSASSVNQGGRDRPAVPMQLDRRAAVDDMPRASVSGRSVGWSATRIEPAAGLRTSSSRPGPSAMHARSGQRDGPDGARQQSPFARGGESRQGPDSRSFRESRPHARHDKEGRIGFPFLLEREPVDDYWVSLVHAQRTTVLELIRDCQRDQDVLKAVTRLGAYDGVYRTKVSMACASHAEAARPHC